jgi:GTP-binding protein HflX
VVDIASPVLDEQMAEVQRVLEEIGADGIPQVLVCNKVDQLEETQRPREPRDVLVLAGGRRVPRVFVSARTGEGMSELRAILSEAAAGTLDGFLNGVGTAADEIGFARFGAEDDEEQVRADGPDGTQH